MCLGHRGHARHRRGHGDPRPSRARRHLRRGAGQHRRPGAPSCATPGCLSLLGLLGGFGGATLAFLWPNLRGGFGRRSTWTPRKRSCGHRHGPWPFAYPAGRMWLTASRPAIDPRRCTPTWSERRGDGAVPHLRAPRVPRPWNVGRSASSALHGSNYNSGRVHPRPRAARARPLRRARGERQVLVDTSRVITGPSRQPRCTTPDDPLHRTGHPGGRRRPRPRPAQHEREPPPPRVEDVPPAMRPGYPTSTRTRRPGALHAVGRRHDGGLALFFPAVLVERVAPAEHETQDFFVEAVARGEQYRRTASQCHSSNPLEGGAAESPYGGTPGRRRR